jgi:hypothetical protein
MAKMAEQCAVDLVHPLATALALCIVCFGDVNRNQSCVVAGQNLRSVRVGRVCEHVKGETFRVLSARGEWEPELKERVEQAVLGILEPAPPIEVPSD